MGILRLSNAMSQNDTVEKELTVLQNKACSALLEGHSVEQAAIQTGCSPSSIKRWLKFPEFSQQLRSGKQAAFSVAATKLANGSNIAVDTLIAILKDSDVSASVKVRACEIVLSNSIKISELEEISYRLTLLEINFSG